MVVIKEVVEICIEGITMEKRISYLFDDLNVVYNLIYKDVHKDNCYSNIFRNLNEVVFDYIVNVFYYNIDYISY